MAEDNFWESDETMSEEEAMAIEQGSQEVQDVEYAGTQEEQSVEDEEIENEEADSQVLKDASLRLEQGNLYKMLLKHDLFEGVEADPRAITNVQRELRAFIRDRLEILVGLKTDPKITPKAIQVQMPFSELEIQLLKEFLAKVTGKTEPSKPASIKPATAQQSAPLKIKPVLGNSNVKTSPAKKAAPVQKQQVPAKEEPRLKKAPSEMTTSELIEYNKKIVATRQHGKKAIAQKKLAMPDSQQLERMYTNNLQTDSGGSLINAILNKMGKGPPSIIENVGGDYDDSNDGRM